MIKRIIFDLDDTLIMWKKEYLNALEQTIREYKINIDLNKINSLIDKYDNEFSYYNKELMVDFINKNIETKINIEFLNKFLDKFGLMSEEDIEVTKVLKYLSTKYELVVLTNWFLSPQIERLKHANILKYFKEVIGGEKNMKPNKDAFILACGKYKPNECVMIGDDYQKDIIGANNANLHVIFFNYKNKDNKLNFKEIKKIKELERIF